MATALTKLTDPDCKGWVGVDLDGTLAYYPEGSGINDIGPPIPAMLDRVKKWLGYGYRVKILTARLGDVHASAGQVKLIQDWCELHTGHRLEVTATKDYAMVELWDDRAVRVERNTGAMLSNSDIERPAGRY